MNYENMDFVRGLSATNRRGHFADSSCTLFRVGPLVSNVAAGYDDGLL